MTFVYVISKIVEGVGVGPTKVGIAGHPRRRLNQIRTAAPFPIAIFQTFETPEREIAKELERGFHHTQRDRRLHGEWFDMTANFAIVLMRINYEVALHYHTRLSKEERRQIIALSMGEQLQ